MKEVSHNKMVGTVGEDIAAEYVALELKMQIIERNWRKQNKELDIIAISRNTLRIIEVKSRMEDSKETISASLNSKKLKNIVKGASLYIGSQRFSGIDEIFFDLIEVIFTRSGEHTIEYTPKFFYPSW